MWQITVRDPVAAELTKHPETDRLHFFTFPTRVLRDQMIARLRSEGVQFLPRGKGPNDEDLFFEAVGEQYELQFPGAASAPSKVLPIFVFFKVALSLCRYMQCNIFHSQFLQRSRERNSDVLLA